MPSPPTSTSPLFLFSSFLPPLSGVILIRRERLVKELKHVITGHLPPVEMQIEKAEETLEMLIQIHLKLQV